MDRDSYAAELRPLLAPAAGYARSILHDLHSAEDAVQQAALRGLERLATYDDSRSFRAWWFTLVHRCCIDLLRADRRNSQVIQNGTDDTTPDPVPEFHDAERLIAAIGQLSQDHQDILRLKYFAELSYREIADSLAIPQGTVMSRLHLARNALAAILQEVPS